MLKTWFTKPLPWILIGLVFFVGYQAIRWREALFGLYLYRVPLDFHEVIFYGFTALYNDIVVPFAIFLIVVCGGLVALTSHDFTFDLDRVQLRSLRFIRAWKTISRSPLTLKDSIRICWDARPNDTFLFRGHWLHGRWYELWLRVRWVLMFAVASLVGDKSADWIQGTSHILNLAAATGLRNALSDREFRSLVLHGYPTMVFLSVLALIAATIATWILSSWSDTRLKNLLVLVPAYLISRWLIVYAPQLAGFELAGKRCPRIRLIVDSKTPPPLMGTAFLAEMTRDLDRCYLVSEDPETDALLVVRKRKAAPDQNQVSLFLVPKSIMPPYEIESNENVLRALATP